MSQPINESPMHPSCRGGSKPGASICDDCIRAEIEPIYYPAHAGFYSSQPSSQSGTRSTISHPATASMSYTSQNSSNNSANSQSPNTFFLSQLPSNDGSHSSDISNLAAQEIADYTPSTVLESAGRTPPPTVTPPKMSFSNNLAYIDEKLLQFASVQHKSKLFEHAPLYPPGLTLNHDAAVGVHHSPLIYHAAEVKQMRQVPHLSPIKPARRSHSKIAREEYESSPPEDRSYVPSQDSEQLEPEHTMKRRKLVQHDSNVSAHKFVATEPASLRKARSLVAGDIGFVPRQPATAGVARPKALPIAVPVVWPQDAALVRLRNLVKRENIQRADDLKHIMAAQQPSACKFDLQIYIEAVDWILSVHAPRGAHLKPLRRHLRTSLETRFHAVWLFSRYASRLSSPTANPFLMPRQGKEAPYQRRVRARLTREVALGCLAIAAKFHHDFLPPLLPLTVDQFLELAGEEYTITFDDLELVQNAILKSFNYIINQPTPQGFLQEIWKVCPTLQNLQDGNFDLPRSEVQTQVIALIETCLIEREMMDYPVSSFTAASLLESLHLCELHQQCNVHSGGRWIQEDSAEEKPPIARVCAGCVNQELCDALQLPRHALNSCRNWIMAVWTGED